MITLLPLSVVTGGEGVLGAVATSQLPATEGDEKPNAFLART
jgi:hypothetical protein